MTEKAQTGTARATAPFDGSAESRASRTPANDNATMLDVIAGMNEASRCVATATRLTGMLATGEANWALIEAGIEAALSDAYQTLLRVYVVLDELHEEQRWAAVPSR